MGLCTLGSLLTNVGNYDRAVETLDASLAIWRDLDQPYWIATALHELGDAHYRRGDQAISQRMHEEALAIWRELGHRLWIAWETHYLADIEKDAGAYARAATYWQESLAISREERITWGVANVVRGVAGLADVYGQADRVTRLYAAAVRLRVSIGLPDVWPQDRAHFAGMIGRVRAQMGEAAFSAAWAYGEAMSLDDAIAEAELVLATPPPAPVVPPAVDPARGTGLTPRELEVLGLIAAGHSNRRVAEALFISPRTVDNHVSNLLSKLDARSSREAVFEARRRGIL
jgi:DNA-binding CsgD family transcriptional regulator/tetratricopeptide (TPR) repeat protein